MPAADRSFYRNLITVLVIFLGLLAFGCLGYMLLEGWSWTDSLYMTVITLSTVGFGEVRQLSQTGRFFTGIMIVMGVSATAYTFSTVAEFIVTGEFRRHIRRRRMQKRIGKLNAHFIICGYGRFGEQVVKELLNADSELAAVDLLGNLRTDLEDMGAIFIGGDATDDDVLLQAGIEKAVGICCCLPNDSDNVYIALAARGLNPNLTISARANSHGSERKLKSAGVDHIINPYVTSGHRMARQMLSPNIIEFMDVVMPQDTVNSEEPSILIGDIVVSERSTLVGQTLAAAEIRKTTGASILAVRRQTGRIAVNPNLNLILEAGDKLITLGTYDQLDLLATAADDQRRIYTRDNSNLSTLPVSG